MTRARLPSDPCDWLREVGAEPEVVPPHALERVAARLEGTLAAASAGSGSGPNASEPGADASTGVASWFSSPSVTMPALFLAGVVAGASGFAALEGARAPAPPSFPTAALVAAAPELPELEPADGEPGPPATAAPSASVAPKARPSTLASERTLLDRARARMGAGEPEAALSLLEQHARRYPRALLSEEREAMAINALVALGQTPEAERRGRAFLARFPESLVRRSVEAALASQPSRNP